MITVKQAILAKELLEEAFSHEDKAYALVGRIKSECPDFAESAELYNKAQDEVDFVRSGLERKIEKAYVAAREVQAEDMMKASTESMNKVVLVEFDQ